VLHVTVLLRLHAPQLQFKKSIGGSHGSLGDGNAEEPVVSDQVTG
jgi:hypothetical protein